MGPVRKTSGKLTGSALRFIGIYENGGEVPEFETKKTEQYSRQGLNLRDLIASQAGGDDEQSFQNYLSSAGVSRRDQKRLSKAYNTIRNSGFDYILSEDGSGFNVFDKETGAAQTRSGRATGSTKGVNLADLIRLGDNVSKLAGFAAQGLGEYGKNKKPITDTEPRGLPASKTSDVNLTGDPEIDLAEYQPPTAGSTRNQAPAKKQGTAPAKSSPPVVDEAYKRSQDLIMNRNAPANPMTMWGGLARNPAQVHQEQVDSIRMGGNVDEQKLAEHMKGITNRFERAFLPASSLAAGQQMAVSGSLAFPVGRMDAGMNRYSQTSKDLANKASAIYESMVRSGITPDFNEIVSALSDKEISSLLEQNKAALGVVGTAASFIPIGRGISLAGKGTIKGLDKILTKYPRFSKWLASKGIGRTMQQLPKVEKIGSSVSQGAKDFLSRQKALKAAIERMEYEGGLGFSRGGKIAVQNSIDAAAQKIESFHGAPAGKLFSIKSLMGI